MRACACADGTLAMELPEDLLELTRSHGDWTIISFHHGEERFFTTGIEATREEAYTLAARWPHDEHFTLMPITRRAAKRIAHPFDDEDELEFVSLFSFDPVRLEVKCMEEETPPCYESIWSSAIHKYRSDLILISVPRSFAPPEEHAP